MADAGTAIELKSTRELAAMRRAGLLVWLAHQRAARLVRPGTTTAELNGAVRVTFAERQAEPLFLGYPGPTRFPAETCISVNEELVHGIPGPRVLLDGDIVSIDTGCRLNGWCGDAAVTHAVGSVDPQSRSLLQATRKALAVALELIGPDVNWGTIARAMERPVVEAGFSVVTSMVGHGIGRQMHEAPQVPNYWSADWMRDNDFVLRPGMVLAVEPMVNAGRPELKCLDDGWTQIAADRSLAAHFEHTVAVTRDGSRRLTGPPEDSELAEMPDWLGPPGNWLHW